MTRDAAERPARLRRNRDAGDLLLRHAGIVLDFQRAQGTTLVAAEAGEGDNRAQVGTPLNQCRALDGGVECLGLDPNGRRAHQPPVIGGKKAISRAPARAASCFTWVRSSAARIVAALAKAAA